ncbi:hypothetical protein [Streptomyces echinatus]|uniref:hypothetical protein n=1 Tax=Streptomyces echinatus TaxID=67293 RepID=UPI0037B49B31
MPKYAQTDEEADKALREYCDSIGFDAEWITPEDWATTIRIARDKGKGLTVAYGTIDEDRSAMVKAGARTARQGVVDNDPSGLIAAIETHYSLKDSLVLTILKQCRGAYVAGERIDLGLGGKPMHSTAYAELREEWKAAGKLGAGGVYTNFHSFEPQDKAAEGKGNVGGTLAKRKVQGNLLVKINGVKFNMHIDISDK